MKKIIISIVLVTSTIFLTYYIYYNNYSNKGIIVNSTTRSTIIDSSTLSMMLETNFNSGMYEVSSDTSWPGTGYVFNETLSKCSNGGTISYDKDTNTVYFSGVSKDYCYVYFDKTITLTDYIISIYSEDGVNNLYYFDGNGSYSNASLEASDYSYRYSGSDYVLTDKATNEGYTAISNTIADSTSGIISFYCSYDDTYNFVGAYCNSNYTSYYYLSYDKSIQYSNFKDAISQAINDGYLKNNYINNYVCLGEDCSNSDNLYRIIGLFLNENTGEYEVKLIKYDYCTGEMCGMDGDYYDTIYNMNENNNPPVNSGYYIGNSDLTDLGSYAWNGTNYDLAFNSTGYYNVWSYSKLNTVNLNNNFYNNLDDKYKNMISEHTWIVGGNSDENISTESTSLIAYTSEIENANQDVEHDLKSYIGLLYSNEYYYAATSKYWSYLGYDGDNWLDYRNTIGENWIFMGNIEWTITRTTSSNKIAFFISVYGVLSTVTSSSVETLHMAIRPTFYLTSSVEYSSGSGTLDDPIILITE